MATRQSGRITHWKDDRGFGFIRPVNGDSDVFVHISAFDNQRRRPIENEGVTFQVKTDADGRLRAHRVKIIGERPKPQAQSHKPVVTALTVAGIFLTGVCALVLSGRLPPGVFMIYLTASVVSFVIYWRDKSSARNEARRTPEKTLHLLGLAGGWPGGLIARQVFRHKSKKQSFITMFWITVVLNCGALVWLLSAG